VGAPDSDAARGGRLDPPKYPVRGAEQVTMPTKARASGVVVQGRFGRREFLAAGVTSAAALTARGLLKPTAAGASANGTGGRTNGPGRNGISAASPRRGGALTYGIDSEEQGFDPTSAEWDENGYMYGMTVFDPLTAVTTTGQVVPYLAQSVTPNSNYTSWMITLRPHVTFHDGTPCDAAALYTNLEKASSSLLTGAVFSQFVKEATPTGPLTLRLDMRSSMVTLPYYLSSQIGYVAAPSMLNSPNGTEHPIGTGPFVFTKWVPNTHFTAARNHHYWRAGLPYLDRITYKPIIEETSRAEALQLGSIDIMNTPSPQTIVQFRGKHQWSYVDDSVGVVGEPTVACIQMNCGAAPFNDKNARVAMAKAYSQADICKTFGLGVTSPVNSPFFHGTPYYRETSYPGYDPGGARAAVKAYEHRHGGPLAFTLNYIPDPNVERVAYYLQQRYQDVGMHVSLAVVGQNELIDTAVAGKYQAMTWRQFGTSNPDLNYVFWSDATVNDAGLSLNIARNRDPRIQSALVTGRQSPVAADRVKAYQDIGEYLAQDLPYTWLGRTVWAVVANPKVQNFNDPLAPDGTRLIGMNRGTTSPTRVWLAA
jgi:ABC-type transport system substrate-binding protein